MFPQIIGEGSTAETDLEHDQKCDHLGDHFFRKQKDQDIQGRSRVIGRLSDKVLAHSCLPAVDQALPCKDSAADLLNIGSILMKQIHLQDRAVSKGPYIPSHTDEEEDSNTYPEG